jgi:hypothetical protein
VAAQASVGGNVQVQVDAGAITSVANNAIFAHSLNGSTQVAIDGGTLSGAAGLAVVQAFTDFTGTGNVNVKLGGGVIDGTVNGSSFGILATTGIAPIGTVFDTTNTGSVQVETVAGSQIKMNGGVGVEAGVFGGTGAATVTVGGTIAGANTGVDAFINNPGNAGAVTVNLNNNVDANNIGISARVQNGVNGSVIVAGNGLGNIGQTTAPSQFGILANDNAIGTGGVSVTGFGNVTSTGTAISANISNFASGDLLVQGIGAIKGGAGFAFDPNAVTAVADPTRGAGVDAQTNGTGKVTVQLGGGVNVTNGIGVLASAPQNNVLVDTTGGVVTATGTGAVGNDAIVARSIGAGSTGNVVVKTDAITELNANNNAINATAISGSVTVHANGLVTGGGTSGTGIIATNTIGGAASLISVTAAGLVTGANGIDAGSITTASPVSVVAAGGVTSSNGVGVRARGTTGQIMVDATGGTVSATNGSGVIALSTSGAVQINTAKVGAIGGDGINVNTVNGVIIVQSGGAVTSDIGFGIFAQQSAGAGGDVKVLAQDIVTGKIAGIGGIAAATNNLTITANKNVTGTQGTGIFSFVDAGTANINVNNTGTTITGTGLGASGISSSTGNGGITNVNIALGTLVTDVLGRGVTLGAIGSGIDNVFNAGAIVGAGTTLNPVVSISNATGVTTIDNFGPGLVASNSTPTAAANNAAVIFTSTPGATGANNINNMGTLIGAIALGGGENVFSNMAGGQWVVSDNAGFVSAAFGVGGVNQLNNNLDAVIYAGAATGSVGNFTGLQSVNNAGTFFSGNAPSNITNINPNAATAQKVVNTGLFNVNGRLNFADLGTQAAGSSFGNGTAAGAGVIDMSTYAASTARDGTVFPASAHIVSDVVSLGTIAATGSFDLGYNYTFGPAYNFVGGPMSVLNVDTKVGAPGSASDRLIISGAAAGRTAINLWDTSSGSGSFNPLGITIVAVNGASNSAFFLASQDNPAHNTPGTSQFDLFEPGVGPMGAIKKGLFFYPLLQDTAGFAAQGGGGAGSRYALFGLPDNEAFQLPIAMTAAQNIWNESALTWLDRQTELRNCLRLTQERASNALLPKDQLPLACGSTLNLPGGDWKPGFWIKGGGAWIDRTASASLGGVVTAAAVLGNINLDQKQDIVSVIGGVDLGTVSLLSANDAFVAQAIGGYLQSNLNFKQSPASFSFSGGTAGVALTYLNSGVFVDSLFKADLLNYSLNFPTLALFGSPQASGSATSLGWVGNLGYRWEFVDPALGLHDYIEPIGTLTYVGTRFDNLNIAGAAAVFQGGVSFRGAIGARVGSVIVDTPTYDVDASITGKFWDQFRRTNGVTLVSDGPSLTLFDRYQRQFGEFAGLIAVTNKESGVSAYANAYTKFNNDFTIVGVKVGLNYQW